MTYKPKNKRPTTPPGWVDAWDAAEIIKCHPETLRSHIRKGKWKIRTARFPVPGYGWTHRQYLYNLDDVHKVAREQHAVRY